MAAADKKISVVGLGRLGLCQALTFEAAGWDVVGCDVHPSYVASINDKTLRSGEPQVEAMLQQSRLLRATLSLEETLRHSDLIMILVATPTGIGEHAYDTGTLSKVLDEIAALGTSGKHVVIGCTVLPGYIASTGSFLLERCPQCTLSYNPEFIAQGRIIEGLLAPDVVLIGEGSSAAGDRLQALYESCTRNAPRICRMSAASAEIMKLSLNCFITTKIAFANAIADVADRTPGADKFAILEAIGADSRVGDRCLMPGYGFGGPCFPRDNRAFGLYARSVGAPAVLGEATDAANQQHAELMARELLEEGREQFTFEDVAFRPGCPADIIEESQPLEVAKRLAKAGRRVYIRDRKGIIDLVRRTYGRLFEYEYTAPAAAAPEASNGLHPSQKRPWQEMTDPTMGNPSSSYRR